MDISDTSVSPSQDINNPPSHEVLRLSNTQNTEEILDNKQHEDNTTNLPINKNTSSIQNATNSHPLMYSPTTPISPDFPDLIPEKPKTKHSSYDRQHFAPQAHSSIIESTLDSRESFENQLNLDLPLDSYSEKLPGLHPFTTLNPRCLTPRFFTDFPESPSALKKSLLYDLPVESAHEVHSDNENEKSVYEAHLSSNLQKVALTMNEKEGKIRQQTAKVISLTSLTFFFRQSQFSCTQQTQQQIATHQSNPHTN